MYGTNLIPLYDPIMELMSEYDIWFCLIEYALGDERLKFRQRIREKKKYIEKVR